MPVSLRQLLSLSGPLLGALRRAGRRGDVGDPQAAETMRRAGEARRAGRGEEAATLYRFVLQRWPEHPDALRGLRDLAVERGDWDEAVALQARVLAVASLGDRAAEAEWLAVGHYEAGRLGLARDDPAAAIVHFRASVRADRQFLPAAIALGDAHAAAGDQREAVRAWERAAEMRPALPVLARLERVYREEGRPTRMIGLYRSATERAPDDLAVAAALGRVYFELEMLDEAAEVFEKLEVRAPDLAVVHAFLGAVFERRGDTRDALEEYRRALRLGHGFDWPHRCQACGASVSTWRDRCPTCHRWNTLVAASAR